MRASAPEKPKGAAWLVLGAAVLWMALAILLPLASVFIEAFRQGVSAYFAAFQDPDALAAIKLSLQVAALAVPLNAAFGLSAAWLISKFEFVGSGLVWVLLFGASGWFGPLLDKLGVQIVFTYTGILLATILVTFPFVARELIPLMQAQGTDEETAAVTLGAGAGDIFWRVTLPNIAWAVLYGVLLCNARAMGEFGAVSVVSGHIRGLTDTMPLHVEVLYNDYNFVAAFAVASLLAGLALVTLAAKTLLEWRFSGELARAARH
jgi:sulfate transport system permease protein